jgi:rhodanese-related sulfurtransferase
VTANPQPDADVAEISREELRRRLYDPTLTVVDVLPAESWRQRHLPGAVNLPLADVPTRAREVLPDRSRDIVVYCATFT